MKRILVTIVLSWSILLQAGGFPWEKPDGAPEDDSLTINGYESAKSIDKIKSGLPFASEWKSFDWQGNKLLVGLSELPTYGESYIDVHGYIYNRSFKEWRRFCCVKTRNVGWAEVGLDEKEEELYLLAKANTPMKGKRVFTYSLLLLSDDRAYVPEGEREKDKEEPAPESTGEAKAKKQTKSGRKPKS